MMDRLRDMVGPALVMAVALGVIWFVGRRKRSGIALPQVDRNTADRQNERAVLKRMTDARRKARLGGVDLNGSHR